MAVSSEIKSGRVPDDNFIFWLTRKNGAWLVKNVELKADEALSVPIEEFCRKHPQARMIPRDFKGSVKLPAELLDKRNQLLAKADVEIREGLIKLAERFPQLTKSRDWQRFSSVTSSAASVSRIGIHLHHSYGFKGGNSPVPVPEEDRYSVLVIVRPPPQLPEQLMMWPIYPGLRLVGQIGTGAGASELAGALTKLVKDALEPLQKLETRAQKTSVQIEAEDVVCDEVLPGSEAPSGLGKSTVGQKDSGLGKLFAEADIGAAVKILSTDYTATAGDGPMYAEARVLKVIKGIVSTGSKLHFGETGWWSPTYKKGEYRIVFLARIDPRDYFKSGLSTIYASHIDFFFAEDSLKDLSWESLLTFLKETRRISDVSPIIEFGITRKDKTTRTLSVKIINNEEQAFWLNPSRIKVRFTANGRICGPTVLWADHEDDLWKKIEPGSNITGSIEIKDEEISQEQEIKLTLSCSSICFPHPCWIGRKSGKVNVTTPRVN